MGALTARPYRFKARPWDLSTVETSCQACSVGCRGALESTSNRLVRLLGVDSEPVNQGWLCDKGRYGYEYVHSDARMDTPRVRHHADLVDTSWPEALDAAAAALRNVLASSGPSAIAVLGGANGTNEDAYAWARFAKGVLRTDNVDSQMGDGLPAEVVLGLPRATIADLDRAKAIVLVGPDLKQELPVLYLRVRRAAVDLDIPLIDVSARDHGLTKYATSVLRHLPGEEGATAASLARALAGETTGLHSIDDIGRNLADREGPVVVVLGRASVAQPADSFVHAAAKLAAVPGVKFLSALPRANVHGALDLGLAPGFLPGRVTLDAGYEHFAAAWGAVPELRGLDAEGILRAAADGSIEALVLVDADPLVDFPDRALAERGARELPGRDQRRRVPRRRRDPGRHGAPHDALGRARRAAPPTSRAACSAWAARSLPTGRRCPAWRVASELALRFGSDFDLETVDELQREIARVAPTFAGVDDALLRRARDGVVLPLAEHADEVAFGIGRSSAGVSWEPIPPEPADPDGVVIEGAAAEAAEAAAQPKKPTPRKPTPHGSRRRRRGGSGAGAVPLERVRGSRRPRCRWTRTLCDSWRAACSTGRIGSSSRRRPSRSSRRARGCRSIPTTVTASASATARWSGPRPAGAASSSRWSPTPTLPRASRSSRSTRPVPGAADLVDLSEPVTDLRVETVW